MKRIDSRTSVPSRSITARTYERLGFERPGDVIALCYDCHHDRHRALLLRAIRATENATAMTVSDVLQKVG
jgi:hypothetical protein